MDNLELHPKVYIKNITPFNNYFFGYYGINPLDSTENNILLHQVISPPESVQPKALIGLWNGNHFIQLSWTNTYNYQQGSKLQWLDRLSPKIIFNRYENSGLKSIIFDLTSKKELIIPYPIYDLAPSGTCFCTISFFSLKKFRRGYSYTILPEKKEKPYLSVFDLKSMSIHVLITLDQILDYLNDKSLNQDSCWIDHPLFAPDGKSILFMLRWYDSKESLCTKILTISSDGKNLKGYADLGNYSHAYWLSPNKFIISCRLQARQTNEKGISILKKFLLPFYRQLNSLRFVKKFRNTVVKERYILFETTSEEYFTIENENMYRDGHPSQHPSYKNIIITDSYPDHNDIRKLILYDLDSGKSVIIAKIFSPNQKPSSDYRCDLHPRWSENGLVCFDNAFNGKRQTIVVDIKNIIKEMKDER